MSKKIKNNIENSILSGLSLAAVIAIISIWIEKILPVNYIGASIIALILGMIINTIKTPSKTVKKGLEFTSKKILRLAIILLGASLSVGTIINVGKFSLTVMIFTLITCFGGGYLLGKILGLNWKLSNLISAGTGICGGSAIAAISPVIEAKDSDIAYAMSSTFIFDVAMILLFPLMGKFYQLSDMAYGLWTGTAVNDTSSVVAAGYAFSEKAGDFAVMVKLTRTLSIIPIVIIFAIINSKIKEKENQKDSSQKAGKKKITSLFPWFIIYFVLLSVLNSFGIIPANISLLLKDLSKFLMVAALAAIGTNTSLRELKSLGIKPMFHGFSVSLAVVVVAFIVEKAMGLI